MSAKVVETKKRFLGIRRVLAAFLMLIFSVTICAPCAFAEGGYVTNTIDLGAKYLEQSLEMWHYSGGYWKVGNDYTTAIKVADKDIGNAANIAGYLQSTQLVSFRIELPAAWRKQLKAGDEIFFVPAAASVPLNQIFDSSTFTGYYEEPYYYVQVKPRFVLSEGNSFDRYVSGVHVSLPLIHNKYGENLYAIYKGGKALGAGSGWFSESAVSAMKTPHIHPSMIKNSNGAFKSGYTINNLIGTMESSGYSVGNGTFANGGAVGIKFNFSVNLLFKAVRREWVDSVATDGGIGAPGGGVGTGGGPGSGSPDSAGPGSSGGADIPSPGGGSDSPGGDSDPGGSPGTGGGYYPDPDDPPGSDPYHPVIPFMPSKWRIHRVR